MSARHPTSVLRRAHPWLLLLALGQRFVHVLVDGNIVKTGGKELALELEAKGYDWILKRQAVAA